MYTKTIVTSTQHSTRHYQRGSWHAITPLYAYIFIFNKNKIFIVYLISLFFPSFSFIYCGSVHISYSFMVATTCIYRPYILYKLYIGSAYPSCCYHKILWYMDTNTINEGENCWKLGNSMLRAPMDI